MTRRYVFAVGDVHSSGLPGGEYLVTEYDDESCELAYRVQRHHVWGPPVQVTRTDHDEASL